MLHLLGCDRAGVRLDGLSDLLLQRHLAYDRGDARLDHWIERDGFEFGPFFGVDCARSRWLFK